MPEQHNAPAPNSPAGDSVTRRSVREVPYVTVRRSPLMGLVDIVAGLANERGEMNDDLLAVLADLGIWEADHGCEVPPEAPPGLGWVRTEGLGWKWDGPHGWVRALSEGTQFVADRPAHLPADFVWCEDHEVPCWHSPVHHDPGPSQEPYRQGQGDDEVRRGWAQLEHGDATDFVMGEVRDLDNRRRISLRGFGEHTRYRMETNEEGVIRLTPLIDLTIREAIALGIVEGEAATREGAEAADENPETVAPLGAGLDGGSRPLPPHGQEADRG